ncbi:MAG: hypothetical protein QOI66_690, partial [Myxococcales bacterium]|nr:hypothetical protein [Myxococcales bacterium]
WAQRGDSASALLRAGCQMAGASDLDPLACAGGLATLIGGRAYRRPLFDEERQILVDAFSEGFSDSVESGVVALVMSVLQAPQFVYRVELGDGSKGQGQRDLPPPTPYELAARLSALLLSDLPDEPLRAAAAAGQLRTADQVGTQVKRLLADPRGHAVSERFYRGWLSDFVGEGGLVDAERDPKLFPTFTPAVSVDMTRELLRFVDHHYWETDSDVASLLTAPYTFVTPALAQHYGLTVPAGADPTTLTQVPLDGRRRGGLLTQGALMTGMAHYATTSPVHRGKFVVEAMLCMQLPPPPPSVPPIPPDLPPPNSTNRQVLETYTSSPPCNSCHQLMDPPGFTFEHFDPVGRWQDTDHGLPIDSSANLRSPLWDPPATVVDAMELAAVMARSDTVRQCVVRTWFHFAFGRPADDNTDRCALQELDAAFRAGGSHVRDLVPLLTTSRPYLAPSRDQGGNGI